MRFVHDFASESGGAPGAFAVEAYDAGRAILAAAEGSPDARTAVVGALEEHGLEGLLGRYRLEVDGSLLEAPAPPHAWRAFGSRWLPVGGPLALLPLTALPGAMVLARVPPRTGPDGPSNVHRTGEET
jgi:hypothetical protein